MLIPAPLPSVEEVKNRLRVIFPEGTTQRSSLISEASAKTVFTMLFIDAIEGQGAMLAPKHVYRMAQEVADNQSDENRRSYAIRCLKPKYQAEGEPWYADTTKELIRDDTIREALVPIGVVSIDGSVPTTSSKGRYALKRPFAELFKLSDTELQSKIGEWQENFLSTSELAKVRILQDRDNHPDSVIVTLPNRETRLMKAGKSSIITKAVIESFAPYFLTKPYVIWISESGQKVIHQDNQLMQRLGLQIDEQTLLPDLILADIRDDGILIIFVEIIATDGVITPTRKQILSDLAKEAGYHEKHIAFVSAFEHRDAAPLKKRLSGIATDTIIWCMSEPKVVIWIGETQSLPISVQQWLD